MHSYVSVWEHDHRDNPGILSGQPLGQFCYPSNAPHYLADGIALEWAAVYQNAFSVVGNAASVSLSLDQKYCAVGAHHNMVHVAISVFDIVEH